MTNLVPIHLANKLRRSSLLFIGYGLRDWNLRVILHRIAEEQPLKAVSRAVQYDIDELENKFWEARGVDIFDLKREGLTLDRYVATLEKAVEDLPDA